jgi:hypothetical protein
MTTALIAEQLDGTEYPVHIPNDIVKSAKEHGIVIVYGASDDLMEFEGAISDEVGAYEGNTVKVSPQGLLPDFENIDKDARDAKDKLRAYFAAENLGRTIEALWCKEPGYSWTFKTDIPHETFEVVEDGDPYCRGIVFRLEDCQ